MRITIDHMGQQGQGAGVHDGERVFVAGAVPGDIVEAEAGRLVSVVESSPDRIAPHCSHFGTCGGCQVQHWAEAPYRTWKRDLVIGALRHRGIDAAVDDLVDAHGHGRRRAALHVRRTDDGVAAGFMESRSHRVAAIGHCPILEPALAQAPAIARAIGLHAGNCDVLLTASDQGLDVAVKAERSAQKALLGKLAAVATAHDLARLTLNGETVAERRPPTVIMGGAAVRLPPNVFLQATRLGEETLAALVLDHLSGVKSAADLFCGTGPFALRLASAMKVHAIDSDGAAISALAEAARHARGLKPVTTAKRDLLREPLVASELDGFGAVVFDPPRAGAEAQAHQIARSKLKLAVAVSCDPQTFARDAAILIAAGFRLERVTPVDQFRHTPHVEIVGLFRRQSLARST